MPTYRDEAERMEEFFFRQRKKKNFFFFKLQIRPGQMFRISFNTLLISEDRRMVLDKTREEAVM